MAPYDRDDEPYHDDEDDVEDNPYRPQRGSRGSPAHRRSGPRRTVPNYLVQGILVTLCCCLPFGIVSIFYAAQVNNLLANGQNRQARQASQKAKMWAMIGFVCGLVINALVFGLQILAAALAG